MADPKYGATSISFAEALGRTLAASEALEKSLARLTATEAASTRTVGANTAARDALTAAMARQAEAAAAVAAALGAETRAMEANSAAWRTNAAARAATGVETAVGGAAGARGSRYGGSGVSLGPLVAEDARAAEVRGTANAAAQVAAEERFFSRQYERSGVGGPGRYKYNLPTIGESPPLRALPEDPATRRLLEGAQTRQPLLLGAGPPVPRTVPTVNYGASLKEYTKDEEKAIAAGQGLVAGQGEVESALARTNAAYRVSVAEVAASSQALQRHGALTAEFVQALARGEVTLAEFGSQLTTTIGKFAGWAVAGGLVYGAYEALKTLGRGAADTASGIAQLERTGVPINRAEAASGFRQLSSETNVPISEAANAQFYAIRSGFHDQKESLEVAKTILLAYKLDLVSVSEAARSFGALHKTMGLDAKGVAGVFNELDQGQRQYNARLQQTLPQVGRAAASWAEAGGQAKGLVAAIVAINSATGGGGGTGGGNPATAILRLPANLERPQLQQSLRDLGIQPVNRETGSAGNVEHLLLGRGPQDIRGAIERGSFDPAQIRKAAQDLGQAAVGLRYFSPLLQQFVVNKRTGASPFTELERGLQQPGSANEDLEKKLSQFDEVLEKVPRTLERIGSEIGNIGITQALEAAAIAFVVVAEGVEKVLEPLSALGQTLSALPGPLRDLLFIGGGAFAVSRGASRIVPSGLRRPVGEVPGLGFLDSPSQRALREARATVRTGVKSGQDEVEQAAARNKAAAVAAQDAAERAETFRANNAAQIVRLQREPGFAATPAGEKFIAETEKVEQERAAAANKGRASSEALTRTKTRLLAEEKLQTDLDDRRIALRDKLAKTGAIAPFGAPTTENIEGPSGPVGSSAEARGLATPGGLIIPGGYRPGDLRGTQVRATAEAAGTTALDGVTLGWAGGLAAAAGNAAGKAKAIGERASVTAGKFTQGFGERAMRGLMVAFVGQLAAEIAGERLGLGSDVQSAISTAALGAGIGSLLPGKYGLAGGGLAGLGLGLAQQSRPGSAASIATGAIAGAGAGWLFTAPVAAALDATGIGLPAGLVASGAGALVGGVAGGLGLLGGGKQDAISPLQKREAEAQKRYLEGELGRAREIEPIGREFATELNNAFKGTGESAQKAMSSITKAIGNQTSVIKTFGITSEQGQVAAQHLREEAAIALARAAQSPAYAEEASRLAEAAFKAQTTGIEDRFKTYLETDRTPKGIANATQQAQAQAREALQQNFNAPLKYQEENLAAIRSHREDLERVKREDHLTGASNQSLADQYGKTVPEYSEHERAAEAAIKGLKNSYPKLLAELYEAIELFAKDGEALFNAGLKARGALRRAQAGADPGALREAAATERAEELAFKRRNAHTPAQHEIVENLEAEDHAKKIEQSREGSSEGAKIRQAERQQRVAEVPPYLGTARAGAALQAAEQDAHEIQALGTKVYSPLEIKEAGRKVIEAKNAFAEAAYSEASQIVQLQGQIAQASAFGSAIAEAQAAIGAAGALAAIARTPAERLQAQLAGIQAQNQLFQAEQAHIGDVGALRESRQAEPLAKERTGIRTAEEKLKRAKPDERIALQADINNKKRAYHEGQVSEAEEVFQFEFNQHEINVTQLSEKWQQIIRTQHLTRQQRRELLEKIRGAQEQNNADFAVGYIGQVPTLYDARTLTKARAAAQPLLGISYDTIHHTPNLHQNNTIQVNVTGAHPGQLVSEMERVFGSLTRAQLRSAGLG